MFIVLDRSHARFRLFQALMLNLFAILVPRVDEDGLVKVVDEGKPEHA